ncbi:hypothetical protein GOV05_03785 [Candidatus Woesearchaeota archaeon]|nr:hypothetical protein [Candidatus Woesearchaeota archaeon]
MAKKKEEETGGDSGSKKSSFFDGLGFFNDFFDLFSTLFKSKTVKVLNLTSKAIGAFTKKIDREVTHIKKKVRDALIEAFFFMAAAFFLLIGFTIFLEKLVPSLDGGLNFIVVGGFFLVVGLFYLLLSKKD